METQGPGPSSAVCPDHKQGAGVEVEPAGIGLACNGHSAGPKSHIIICNVLPKLSIIIFKRDFWVLGLYIEDNPFHLERREGHGAAPHSMPWKSLSIPQCGIFRRVKD